MSGSSALPPPRMPGSGPDTVDPVESGRAGQRGGSGAAGNRADVDLRQTLPTGTDDGPTLADVFDTEVVGLAILDDAGRVLQANPALCALLGRTAPEVIGLPFESFHQPDDEASHLLPASSDHLTVHRLHRNSGLSAWAAIELRPLSHPFGSARTVVVAQDVTTLKEHAEALEHTSRFDAATGVANRASFRVCVERELGRVQRTGDHLALLWLDLDRFKEVNDQYGHAIGDTVLSVVAERLQAAVHGRGFVGRAGGDEFAMLLPGAPATSDLDLFVERMLAAVREPIYCASCDEVHVSSSIGVAVYPEDGSSADGVMRSAEQAMYAAKDAGGSTARYFRRDMNTQAEQGRKLRHELAAAIEQRDFELHYQPIVNPRDGGVHGVEALCRWKRAGELVSADRFIHFCEHSGQIRQLGLITLELLRQDLELLRAAGHNALPVSVNLSATQLADAPHLEALRAWPEPPALQGVEVEVTEAAFLPDNNRAAEAVAQLAQMGATISVDDFGTGFSNLRMLQTLAPAKIKLDQSFLTNHDDAARSRTLMEVAIHMAHTLGAVVIAEGVEDQAQRDQAEHLGADLVQGFCIALPMPVSDLITWLRDRRVLPTARQAPLPPA